MQKPRLGEVSISGAISSALWAWVDPILRLMGGFLTLYHKPCTKVQGQGLRRAKSEILGVEEALARLRPSQ
jgi:hypothetical protein